MRYFIIVFLISTTYITNTSAANMGVTKDNEYTNLSGFLSQCTASLKKEIQDNFSTKHGVEECIKIINNIDDFKKMKLASTLPFTSFELPLEKFRSSYLNINKNKKTFIYINNISNDIDNIKINVFDKLDDLKKLLLSENNKTHIELIPYIKGKINVVSLNMRDSTDLLSSHELKVKRINLVVDDVKVARNIIRILREGNEKLKIKKLDNDMAIKIASEINYAYEPIMKKVIEYLDIVPNIVLVDNDLSRLDSYENTISNLQKTGKKIDACLVIKSKENRNNCLEELKTINR